MRSLSCFQEREPTSDHAEWRDDVREVGFVDQKLTEERAEAIACNDALQIVENPVRSGATQLQPLRDIEVYIEFGDQPANFVAEISQTLAHLPELEVGLANLCQPCREIGNSAVVEAQSFIEGTSRILEMRGRFRQREEALPQLANAFHFFGNEITFVEPVVTNDRSRGIIRVPEPVAILERPCIGPLRGHACAFPK